MYNKFNTNTLLFYTSTIFGRKIYITFCNYNLLKITIIFITAKGELMTDKDELKTLKNDLKEKESEIEDLNKQIEEKDHKIDDYFSQMQRLQADFENYKRRSEKDIDSFRKYANEGLIIKLIDTYEDLERALKSSEDGESLKEGVELIYKNLKKVLEKEGLEEIPTTGEKFDPFKHEALMTENNEDYESGVVTEELAKGYALKSKVIKCAMVKVCKK